MLRTLVPSLAASLMLIASSALAAPEIGKPAPDFSAPTVDGSNAKLSEQKGKIVVIEWHNPGCPFVKKHYGSGNMQQLQSFAQSKNVVWLTINSSAAGKEGAMDPKQARDYVTNSTAVTRYILDTDGSIGKLYDAKVTPHMYIIDASGNLAYMGAIDDKPTANPSDIIGSRNYVREALDSLLAGKPVATTSTQAYGCGVKYGS